MTDKEIYTLLDACLIYQHLDAYDDRMKWHDKAKEIFYDESLLKKLSLEECLCLLVSHAGKNSICDGHFEFIIRSKHMLSILNRIQELSCKVDK